MLAIAIFVPVARAGTQDVQLETVTELSSLEGELMATLNSVRGARGLRPFRPSARLHAAALRHSGEMARFGYFDHSSPNGAAFWRRLKSY